MTNPNQTERWTAGPWMRAVQTGTPYDMLVVQTNWPDRNCQHTVAEVFNPGSTPEHEANARLIAAAPELAEACEAAAAQITNHPDGHHRQFQDVYNQLAAVLAKLKGSR